MLSNSTLRGKEHVRESTANVHNTPRSWKSACPVDLQTLEKSAPFEPTNVWMVHNT